MTTIGIEKLRSGVPGLDIITHGGIPKGRTTLVCGRSGTAKSILSLQLATNLARSGVKTLLVAVEETEADLLESARSLGFDLAGLIARKQALVADITRPTEGPTFVSGDYDLSGFLDRLAHDVKRLGAEAVVLDSATALFNPRPPQDQLRMLFFQLVSAFRKHNLTAIVTAEAAGDYGELTTLGVEDFVCDMVLVLRNLVDGERRRRSVEVHKYRRSSHYKGEYPCTITAKGVIVFPLDAQERTDLPPATRFSSGLDGLDEMTAGGWMRDSLVLMRGPAGSGKTSLCGMYARAGAERGERVVYYGFEETKAILMRNFAALGMPMEPLEKSGHLRIACRYPEATSPEDLLVDLRVGLDEFKPTLVVLDSISAIEHSTSRQGFRQFMVGVASQLREHGRSALMTQTTTGLADEITPFLSTIPDSILLLDYDQDAEDLDRTIQVLKLRGSSHETARRKLVLAQGGPRVAPWERRQRAR